MCVSSKGLKLRITIASVLTVVGNVESVKLPSTTQDIIRCKDLDDDNSRVHAAGSSEGGQVGGSLYYDPADTVHQRMVALVHSNDYATTGLKASERKINWDFQFNQYTTPKLWGFTGVASKFDISAATAAAM